MRSAASPRPLVVAAVDANWSVLLLGDCADSVIIEAAIWPKVWHVDLKAVIHLITNFIKFEYDLQAFPAHSQQHFKRHWKAAKVIPTHAAEYYSPITAAELSYLQSFANLPKLAIN